MTTTFYFTSGSISGTVLSGPQDPFGVLTVTWSGATSQASSGVPMMMSGVSGITVGTSGVGISGTSAPWSGFAQTQFIQTFVSQPIANQYIHPNTWTFSFVIGESAAAGNFLVSGFGAYIYLFRSGSVTTLAQGFVSGINTASGVLVSGTLISGTVQGISGTANSGDVIVAELYWLSGIQNQSGSVNLSIGFGSGAYL